MSRPPAAGAGAPQLLVEKAHHPIGVDGERRIDRVWDGEEILIRPSDAAIDRLAQVKGEEGARPPVGPGQVDGAALTCARVDRNGEAVPQTLLATRCGPVEL